MNLEVKAFNIIYQNWGKEEDDFFLSCQVDIGIKGQIGSEIYLLDIISPKRLTSIIVGDKIEIGKGYLITADYKENKVKELIDKWINGVNTLDKNIDTVFNEIGSYFKDRL